MELGQDIQTTPPRWPLMLMRASFLTVTDTTISQNIYLSFWTTLYTSSALTPRRNVGKSVQLMILRTIIAIVIISLSLSLLYDGT